MVAGRGCVSRERERGGEGGRKRKGQISEVYKFTQLNRIYEFTYIMSLCCHVAHVAHVAQACTSLKMRSCIAHVFDIVCVSCA